jgi:arginine utilization regulatory protein
MTTEEIEKLILENNVFKKAMDDLLQGVYVTDDKEIIMWLNHAIEESDGMKREDIIGKSEKEAYGEIGRYHHFTTKTGQAVPLHHAYYYINDGSRSDVIMMTQPYFENGVLKAVYTVGIHFNKLQSLAETISSFEYGRQTKKIIKRNRTKYSFDDIIGESKAIKSTIKIARKAALSTANILITGETGTGKELIAQSVHNASHKAGGQFVAINCSAVPETLLEGLLFGTAKGAFTGALETPGLFESANGGSLFLDEINSMPLNLQAKLLRVLEEKEIQRLGERKSRPLDCRVISATNIDPIQAIKQKQLREDIYFRLASVTINIPALRERPEDITPLLKHFIKKYSSNFGVKKTTNDETMRHLLSYAWPGNVRELAQAVQHALAIMEPNERFLTVEHLPPLIKSSIAAPLPHSDSFTNMGPEVLLNSLDLSMQKYEHTLISASLKRNNGNLTRTATEMGLSRQTLTNRIKKNIFFEQEKSERKF